MAHQTSNYPQIPVTSSSNLNTNLQNNSLNQLLFQYLQNQNQLQNNSETIFNSSNLLPILNQQLNDKHFARGQNYNESITQLSKSLSNVNSNFISGQDFQSPVKCDDYMRVTSTIALTPEAKTRLLDPKFQQFVTAVQELEHNMFRHN